VLFTNLRDCCDAVGCEDGRKNYDNHLLNSIMHINKLIRHEWHGGGRTL